VRAALAPIVGAMALGCWYRFSGALAVNAVIFALLLLVSFLTKPKLATASRGSS
jgi:hypothetical protein